MWQHVVWQIFTNILEEHAASVFIYPEDGGILFTSKLHVVPSTSLNLNALILYGNADKGRTFPIYQMAELYRKLFENIFSYIATV